MLVHLGSIVNGYEKTIKFSILLPYSFGPISLGIKNDWINIFDIIFKIIIKKES